MSSGMNTEQAKEYAKTMTYSEAVSNVKYGKYIKYRKATMIKLRELAEIADKLDKADTPQTESTGSPIGDYRDGVGAWQTDRMTEEEFDTKLAKVLVGQTDCGWGEPRNE